jgi:serine/threonine protein kinase
MAIERGHCTYLTCVLSDALDDKKQRKRGSVFMVTPYMDHDLAGLLENPQVRLKVPHIKSYMKQLLQGTAYLHEVPPHSVVINGR